MTLVERAERLKEGGAPASEREARSCYSRVSHSTDLHRILRPDTDLVIWRREIRRDVVAELATLVLDDFDDLLLSSAIDTLDEALSNALAEAGYPDTPGLRADIAMLARQHAALTGDDEIRIRLEVVETDACRKFHADYVKARTITTYLGRGTQWIEAAMPERAGLVDGPPIQQIDTGAVAIFKGRVWREHPGVLHRSPPIGDRQEQRLVLVIDPAPSKEELATRLGASRV